MNEGPVGSRPFSRTGTVYTYLSCITSRLTRERERDRRTYMSIKIETIHQGRRGLKGGGTSLGTSFGKSEKLLNNLQK